MVQRIGGKGGIIMSRREVAIGLSIGLVGMLAYCLACSQADWSPDGRRLAYTLRLVGKKDPAVWVFDFEANRATRVVQSAEYLSPPAWAPDGQSLLFFQSRDLPEEPADSEAQKEDCEKRKETELLLFRYWPVDGRLRVVRRVQSPATGNQEYRGRGIAEPQPQWSPDGRRILWWQPDFDRVQLLDAATGEPTVTLQGAAMPRWSPSGGEVALLLRVQTPANPWLVVARVDALSELAAALPEDAFKEGSLPPDEVFASVKGVRFTHILGDCGASGPAWSPDGRHLAIGQGGDILLVTPGEGQIRQLTLAHAVEGSKKEEGPTIVWLDWDPAGRRLAYATTEPQGLYWTPVDEPEPRVVCCGVEGFLWFHPVWSPDGRRLAYPAYIASGPALPLVVVKELTSGRIVEVLGVEQWPEMAAGGGMSEEKIAEAFVRILDGFFSDRSNIGRAREPLQIMEQFVPVSGLACDRLVARQADRSPLLPRLFRAYYRFFAGEFKGAVSDAENVLARWRARFPGGRRQKESTESLLRLIVASHLASGRPGEARAALERHGLASAWKEVEQRLERERHLRNEYGDSFRKAGPDDVEGLQELAELYWFPLCDYARCARVYARLAEIAPEEEIRKEAELCRQAAERFSRMRRGQEHKGASEPDVRAVVLGAGCGTVLLGAAAVLALRRSSRRRWRDARIG